MAYLFNGATHKIVRGSAVLTAAPFTLHCHAKLTNSADGLNHNLMGITKSSGGGNDVVANMEIPSDKKLHAQVSDSANWSSSTSTTTITDSNKHAFGMVVASATSRTGYVDGVASTTDTTSRTPAGLNETVIGAYINPAGTVNNNVGHTIFEAAIWNVALTADEMATLSQGWSPWFVRPSALVLYSYLMSDSRELAGQSTLTVTGATVADHGNFIYPEGPQIMTRPPFVSDVTQFLRRDRPWRNTLLRM